MKENPIVADDLKIGTFQDFKDHVGKIITRVNGDQQARHEWLERQARYYRRRYAREGRNVDDPWPGASDIVIPTMDMSIDRMKATLSRMIFTRPMVDFVARKSASLERVINARIYFDHLLNERIPDYREQVMIGLDQILQDGYCVFKVIWDYRTEKQQHILRREDLPKVFRMMFPGLDEEEAARESLDNRRFPLANSVLKRLIDDNFEIIEARISRELSLDPEDETDKKAIRSVIDFLRNGEEEVRYTTKQIVANNSRVIAVDAQDCIVPPGSFDIQDAERVTHQIFLTESQFKSRAKHNGWNESAAELVLNKKREEEHSTRGSRERDSILNHYRDAREGLSSLTTDRLIKIWEHYFWHDIDGDGVPERCVTLIHPGTQTVLKAPRQIPYTHGNFPFVQIKFEINEPRFFSSRGIPEKIDDIDREITIRHRMKLNKLEMLVPMFKYRIGSGFSPHNMVFKPGTCVPVGNLDDFDAIQFPDFTAGDRFEENDLFTLIQRYLGGLDSGLVAQDNLSEARTATEIAAIQRTASESLTYKGLIIQTGMKKLYNMIWDLENQYMPKEVWLRVTGSEMTRLTKEQIIGDFEIVPIGTIENTDSAAERQAAFTRFQALLQIAQLGPAALGPEFQIDLGQALMAWLRRDNANDAQVIVRQRKPEEIEALKAQQAQQQELAQRVEGNQGVTVEEARSIMSQAKSKMPFGPSTRILANAGQRRAG